MVLTDQGHPRMLNYGEDLRRSTSPVLAVHDNLTASEIMHYRRRGCSRPALLGTRSDGNELALGGFQDRPGQPAVTSVRNCARRATRFPLFTRIG